MKSFKSSLVVRTASVGEYKLAETIGIHVLPTVFSIANTGDYMYTASNGIEVYTTSPLNKIHAFDYKKEIKDMLLLNDSLYILNDESLIVHTLGNFNISSGNFRNSKLIFITSTSESSKIGVQTPTELELYDGDFRRAEVYRAQCSYAQRDILLLGDFNMLVVFVRGKRTMEIAMPEKVVGLVCDPLFTTIFCACQDSVIYCVSMAGEPIQPMAYHKEPPKHMRLSFCGEFLYSADSKMVCVWGTAHKAVHGFVEFDKPIEDIDLIVEGNRIYKDIPIRIV